MKALIKKPGKPFQRISLNGDLKTLQKLVGGYIEVVPVCKDTVCVCNEEGRLMGLEPNCAINDIDFVGTILIMGSKDCDFCDIEEVVDDDWDFTVVEYVSAREVLEAVLPCQRQRLELLSHRNASLLVSKAGRP